MNNLLSDYNSKIKVFLSSRCGEKASELLVIRRWIKTALESTGIFNVFDYNETNASSQENKSFYLDELDKSNICVFLIDADPITTPVIVEFNRATQSGKRILVYALNDKFDITIKKQLKYKYVTVDHYKEFAEKCIEGVLLEVFNGYQNLINNKGCDFDSVSDSIDLKNIMINNEIVLYKDDYYKGFSKTEKYICDKIGHFYDKNRFGKSDKNDINSLDDYVVSILSSIYDGVEYDKKISLGIIKEVKRQKLMTKVCTDVVKERYKILDYYFNFKYEDALSNVEKLYDEIKNNKDIYFWLRDDVLLDYRNLTLKAPNDKDYKKYLHVHKEIDSLGHQIQNPTIDRYISNFRNNLAKRKNKNTIKPVYNRVLISNYWQEIEKIVQTVVSSVIYGSYIGIYQAIGMIKDLCYYLSNQYSDFIFRKTLITSSIIYGDNDVKDILFRYGFVFGNGNTEDLNKLVDLIKNRYSYDKKRLLETLKPIVYYMSDEKFAEIEKLFWEFAEDCCENNQYLKDECCNFISTTCKRLNQDRIMEFIISIKNIDNNRIKGVINDISCSSIKIDKLSKENLKIYKEMEKNQIKNGDLLNFDSVVDYSKIIEKILKSIITPNPDGNTYSYCGLGTLDKLFFYLYNKANLSNIIKKQIIEKLCFHIIQPRVSRGDIVIALASLCILAKESTLCSIIKLKIQEIKIIKDDMPDFLNRYSNEILEYMFDMLKMICGLSLWKAIDYIAEINVYSDRDKCHILKFWNEIGLDWLNCTNINNEIPIVVISFISSCVKSEKAELYTRAIESCNILMTEGDKFGCEDFLLKELSGINSIKSLYILNAFINNTVSKETKDIVIGKLTGDNHYLVKMKLQEFINKS